MRTWEAPKIDEHPLAAKIGELGIFFHAAGIHGMPFRRRLAIVLSIIAPFFLGRSPRDLLFAKGWSLRNKPQRAEVDFWFIAGNFQQWIGRDSQFRIAFLSPVGV